MARPRSELSPAHEAELLMRAARGETAEHIWNSLGRPLSLPTIDRRVRELRKPKSSSSPAAPTPADVPDEVPASASSADLDRWLKAINAALAKAELDGNLQAIASLAAKATALLKLKHDQAPLPRPDPNENPDFKRLAKDGEDRLLNLIRNVFSNDGGVQSP